MPSDKQAVLLIHGIGEQRPMDTLRGFVRAVWSTDTGLHHQFSPPTVWSKPDTVSGSYELRRLTTGKNRNDVRTDFFEFYWAHLMEGTQLGHVLSWVRVLLLRWPCNVPPRLRGVWALLVVSIVAIVGLLLYNQFLPETDRLLRLPPWASTLVGLALSALTTVVVIQIIGDAARYLNPEPRNIKRRQEIRAKGIELLTRLHEADYRRIIVVGHSLGSVIAYDVLTYAWAEFNTTHDQPDRPEEVRLEALEALIQTQTATPPQYRKAQRAYLEELGANGNPWRVTDLVTLGSPLTHAALLMASDARDLASRKDDRELPSCPPVTEKGRISFSLAYTTRGGAARRLQVPHHAAVFGPTRWTNLYFPVRFVVWGDVIGGPLAEVFGQGIQDLKVKTTQWWGLLSHTLYWAVRDGRPPSESVLRLREALDLADEGVEP